MDEHKSLLLEIAEAIDRRLRERAPRDAGTPSVKRPGWLDWLRRHMVPNIGTLLMVIVLLFTVPSLAAPLRAPAATSTSTISYQGRLADSGGNPLTGKYNLEFRIYDVSSGGVPLWTEMWTGGNGVDVSDGLFNVMLGSIDNTLASSIEGYDELYLGITVGTDSEMEPRVQLGSVPFSMQAMTVPNESITTAKLEDSAVTSAKIQDGQVSSADVGFDYAGSSSKGGAASDVACSNCVSSSEIQNGQVSSADVGFNYAGSSAKGGAASDVACSDCISTGEIGAGEVRSGDIQNGAVTLAKLDRGYVVLEDGWMQIPRKDFDPSSPSNGVIYYNNAANCLRMFANGAWRNLHCWP